MTQSPNRCELLALTLLVAGCHATHNLDFATASPEPDSVRRAPGVAVDPVHQLPAPQASAEAKQGLVVLRAPSKEEPDEGLVERFFQAVSKRDSDQLETLLVPSAKVKTSAASGEMDALDFWKSRLSRLDYGKLSVQNIYRKQAVEVYREQDLELLAGDRQLPTNVGVNQILVRVPVHATEGDKVRLFGNEILFLLTPTDGGLRIAEMIEDFQLP